MKDYFYNNYKKDEDYFVEGPIIKHNIKNAINSSSINTSEIDKYRQGVEITQMKHYALGLFNIYSGNPGHMLSTLNFGTDRRRAGKDYFVDQEKFIAKKYIENLPTIYEQLTNPTSYVVDNDIIDNVAYDGAIEPLTIRAKATFSSTDFPFESHDVRGNIMGGTVDQTGAACQILTVTQRRINPDFVPFLDAIDMFQNGTPTAGFFIYDKTELSPFNDVNSERSVILQNSPVGNEMRNAILKMNPPTENYIPNDKFSSTSGWDYDNNVTIGTDSIAFGGMTYL